MKRRLKFKRGFSLIEILIALSLLFLMVGGGIASYSRFEDRREAEDAARFAETAIRFTQKQATSGVKPNITHCITDDLSGYRIRMIGQTHTIWAVCGGVNVCTKLDVPLPHNAHYNATINLTFDLNGKTSSSYNVCVVNSANNFFYAIRVNEGGSISFLGELGSCP